MNTNNTELVVSNIRSNIRSKIFRNGSKLNEPLPVKLPNHNFVKIQTKFSKKNEEKILTNSSNSADSSSSNSSDSFNLNHLNHLEHLDHALIVKALSDEVIELSCKNRKNRSSVCKYFQKFLSLRSFNHAARYIQTHKFSNISNLSASSLEQISKLISLLQSSKSLESSKLLESSDSLEISRPSPVLDLAYHIKRSIDLNQQFQSRSQLYKYIFPIIKEMSKLITVLRKDFFQIYEDYIDFMLTFREEYGEYPKFIKYCGSGSSNFVIAVSTRTYGRVALRIHIFEDRDPVDPYDDPTPSILESNMKKIIDKFIEKHAKDVNLPLVRSYQFSQSLKYTYWMLSPIAEPPRKFSIKTITRYVEFLFRCSRNLHSAGYIYGDWKRLNVGWNKSIKQFVLIDIDFITIEEAAKDEWIPITHGYNYNNYRDEDTENSENENKSQKKCAERKITLCDELKFTHNKKDKERLKRLDNYVLVKEISCICAAYKYNICNKCEISNEKDSGKDSGKLNEKLNENEISINKEIEITEKYNKLMYDRKINPIFSSITKEAKTEAYDDYYWRDENMKLIKSKIMELIPKLI